MTQDDGNCQWPDCDEEGASYVCPPDHDESVDGRVVCAQHRDVCLRAGFYEVEMVSLEEAVEALRRVGFRPVVTEDKHLWPEGEMFN